MNRLLAEQTVLRLLCHQLRVATHGQLAGGLGQLCGVTVPLAASVLRRLRRQGLVGTQLIPLTIPELTEPIVTWKPTWPAPDFHAVAWAVRKRLVEADTGRERVYWASSLAVQRTGGTGGRLRKPLQIEHDLGVAAVFFARLGRDRTTPQRWQGEDAYCRLRRPTRGQKIPDAVLLASDDANESRFEMVIDYLSLYPPARLRDFHRYWSARKTHYEWW